MLNTYRLKRGPVFQMLVLPTHPLGGSVMFSFSKSSWMDWATTATASLMWADSFFPLMSWRPIRPVTGPTTKQQSLTWLKKTYRASSFDILSKGQTSAAWSSFIACLTFSWRCCCWPLYSMCKESLEVGFWSYWLRFGNQDRQSSICATNNQKCNQK